MFALFAILSCGLRPVILLPPMYGTQLHATYSQIDLPWYCPRTMDNDLFWVDSKLLVPPRYNCIFRLLTVKYDRENDFIMNLPGANITVNNFGSDESLLYVDNGIFGHKFVETYASMFQRFKDGGYVMGVDLFSAPYDWRFAVFGLTKFYQQLKEEIEFAYEKNSQQVVIMGYSTGGFILTYFFNKIVDRIWYTKYVKHIVYLAPSFGGTHLVFDSLYRRYSPVVPMLRNKILGEMCESLPVLHSHLFNHEIFGNLTVLYGPDGDEYNASMLPVILEEHQKIRGDYLKILQKSVEITKRAPMNAILPTTLIYNTGKPTIVAFNFTSWNKNPIKIMGEGDGTLPANGAKWACENWNTDESYLLCIDLLVNQKPFNHQPMVNNPYIIDMIYNYTTNDDWIESDHGRKYIIAPTNGIINRTLVTLNDSYVQSKDL